MCQSGVMTKTLRSGTTPGHQAQEELNSSSAVCIMLSELIREEVLLSVRGQGSAVVHCIHERYRECEAF